MFIWDIKEGGKEKKTFQTVNDKLLLLYFNDESIQEQEPG